MEPGWIFGAVFVLAVGSFVFRMIQKGGFKAAMFGARVRETLGELSLTQRSLMSMTLRVYVLEAPNPDGPAIGLELVTKSVASYHMTPIALTVEQATQLNALLGQALAQSRA